MFKIHAVQAQHGDCLVLQFGTSAHPRFILIDGGPPGNFESDLDQALTEIVGKEGKLDLLVLSHIDNDHVVGVVDLLAALEDDDANDRARRVKITGLWHNSFGQTVDPDGEIVQRLQTLMTMAGSANVAMPLAADAFFGVREGNRLRILSLKLKIPLNKGFKDELILTETSKEAIKLGPLSLRIVGPNKKNLEALRKEWLEWLAKTESDAGADPSTASMSDKSVPNLSSIVFYAQCNGKTALLTGDARGDHILSGLETAKLLKDGKLHVDLLKVQHHGSDRNTTRRFFETITADTYLISANGKYGNPDEETLKWIVEAAHDAGRKITIVVTNATPTTKSLLRSHKPATFGYTLEVKPEAEHSIEVALAE